MSGAADLGPAGSAAHDGRAAPAALHIYYGDSGSLCGAAAEPLIAAEDRAAAATLSNPRRRAERLAGRALLRFALQAETGRRAREHSLRTSITGKPECATGPVFSLAHDRGVVVCAIAARGHVGIDVQLPAPNRNIESIAAHYFAAAEVAWIGASPARFYMLWVLKEAYLKALGTGLAGGLDSLQCRVEPPLLVVNAPADCAPGLALYSFGDGFIAAASLDRSACNARFVAWRRADAGAARPELIARTA